MSEVIRRPEDRRVRIGPISLHYLDWGTAGKPPMLLLHGGSQTAHSWDEFARAMCDRYHIVAPDQRGHGDSDWAPDKDYSRAAFLGDLERLIAHLGWDRFILMGLSMGGMNAITYAGTHPDRVERLVIVDVGPEILPKGVEAIRRFVSAGPDEIDSFDEYVAMAHRFNPRRSIENLRDRLGHNLRQQPNGKWSWKFDKVFRDPDRLPRPDSAALWDLVGRIRAPSLVVRGEQSDVLDPGIADRMAGILPHGSVVTIPGAGHSVMGDNPPAFREAVEHFLAAHPVA